MTQQISKIQQFFKMITKEKTISYIFLQLQQVDELIWLLHFICAAAGVMSLQKAPLLIHSVMRNWVFKTRVLVLEVPSLYVFLQYFIYWFFIMENNFSVHHFEISSNLAKKFGKENEDKSPCSTTQKSDFR